MNGVTKAVANISGHRDWAAAEWPGGNLDALLPALRDVASGDQPPPQDLSAPVISAVTASTTRAGAPVTWVTDEPSTTKVEYRRTKTTTWMSMSDAALTATHSIGIAGLASRTGHQYRVTSADANGNSATCAIASFKTR